jgi:hypothetical protein
MINGGIRWQQAVLFGGSKRWRAITVINPSKWQRIVEIPVWNAKFVIQFIHLSNSTFFVVIEMAPVTYIDSSDAQALKELYQDYKARKKLCL